MAILRTLDGNSEDEIKSIKSMLITAFASAHINFLIGSGASCPAILPAGNVEQKINDLYREGEDAVDKEKCKFLCSIQQPTNDLLNNSENCNNEKTLTNYQGLMESIERILLRRKSSLLPRQANIFTTNYDLFIEKASEKLPNLILNDGFRRMPSLNCRYEFSPQNYFNSTFNTGNLYNYRVEIPTINLVKIHGSLSWEIEGDTVLFNPNKELACEDTKKYIGQFALVLPERRKFRTTVMDRFHYDLLRIYSNALDKENSLLIVFGFSFVDEHIRDITKRALKNPTLKMIIFAYSRDEVAEFEEKFVGYNNVEVIAPGAGEYIDFNKLNEILNVFPHKAEVNKCTAVN